MMRYLLFTFLIVFLFGSCAEKDALSQYRPEIEAPHKVEIIPEDETLVLSDLVDGYKLLELKGALLDYPGGVIAYDSTWIINANSTAGGGLHQFDAQGNFMRTILKGGQGPYEATSLFSMKVVGDDLYLLVNAGIKLLHYSLKEGKFVDSFMMPDEIRAACDFAVLDKGKYVFYKDRPCTQEEEYKLYVYNRVENKIEQRWIPMYNPTGDYLFIGQRNCLYQIDGKCYFYETFQRGIYEVTADGPKGYISFKDNQYTMPDDELYGNYHSLDEFLEHCNETSYVWAHRCVLEGNRFIWSNFMAGGEVYHWNLIDKRQWTSHSYTRIKDDVLLDMEVPFQKYLYQKGIQGDETYFVLPYVKLRDAMEQKKANGKLDAYARKHPDVMELYKTMNEDTNDLIVVFHEKQ